MSPSVRPDMREKQMKRVTVLTETESTSPRMMSGECFAVSEKCKKKSD